MEIGWKLLVGFRLMDSADSEGCPLVLKTLVDAIIDDESQICGAIAVQTNTLVY